MQGPKQNEWVGPLVQTLLRISRIKNFKIKKNIINQVRSPSKGRVLYAWAAPDLKINVHVNCDKLNKS